MMAGLFAAAVYLLILATVVYMIFCVDPNTKGPIGAIRRFVFNKLPAGFTKLGTLIFGRRFKRWMKRLYSYCFEEKNSIVMCLYIAIGPGGYVAYVYYGFMQFWPSKHVSNIHMYTSVVVVSTAFYCYYKAVTTDPGEISKKNAQEYYKKYEEYCDGVLFRKNNVCKTCRFKKPARSKHCSISRVCVAKFDHYCIWIRNVVGEKNYKWFLGFLLSHHIMTLYGAIVGYRVMNGYLIDNGLWTATFRSVETGETYKANYSTIFNYLIYHFPYFIFTILLCFIMSFALFLFFAYHMYLVSINFTTNESIKHGYFKYDYEEAIKHKNETLREILQEEEKEGEGLSEELRKRYSQIQDDVLYCEEQLEILNNINYSRGFWNNLWEVIKA